MKILLCIFSILLATTPLYAGRFEFHQNTQFPNHAVLLDTQTGKIWKQTCFAEQKDEECSVKVWAPSKIVGINTTEAEVWKLVEEEKNMRQNLLNNNLKK